MKILLIAVTVLVIVNLLGLFVINLMSKAPAGLGLRNGRLTPCPDSPNCVCSLDTDPQHKIEPLPCSTDRAAAIDRLEAILNGMDRVVIVDRTDDYLRAEFRSKLLRFVDDVEFHVDTDAGVINIRSASRIGYSDLGINRKRVEQIRDLWNAASSS